MGLAGKEQWQEGFSTPDRRNSMCDLETGVEVGREKEGHILGTARSLSPGGEGRGTHQYSKRLTYIIQNVWFSTKKFIRQQGQKNM